MGKELSTLAELSSDFFYQNQYSNDEAVMVGTDCDARREAEERVEEKILNIQKRKASHLGKRH